MIRAQSQTALPRYSLDRLAPIAPGLIILAFLATSGHGSAGRETLEKTLQPLIPASAIDEALPGLEADGLAAIARSGRCRITPAGRAHAEEALGPCLGRQWSDVVARGLAALALGIDPREEEARLYLARRDNLEAAVLACLYGLAAPGPMPSRTEVRFLFLRALLSARLPEYEAAFTEMTMQNTLRDPVSKALMLGAAGLSRGTLREAEGALLHKALSLAGDGQQHLAEAVVRSAAARPATLRLAPTARVQLRPLTLVQPKEQPAEGNGATEGNGELAAFAATVRELARTQTTHPFAGRVAIAQVYDAAKERGLDFGPLEAFKSRIAEAGRAGLLDLERYDIAGPMDASLRDRSRTPFGRDVRHFIVNEWI